MLVTGQVDGVAVFVPSEAYRMILEFNASRYSFRKVNKIA